jgi:hypothetical protein
VIDSAVQVGAVPAGGTVTSQDTFTIQVDRTTLVSPLPISWRVNFGGGMSSFIAPLEVNAPSSADFDGNGSVDGEDLEHFKACASGADIQPNDSSCLDADLDGDGDVDMDDFGIFQRCFNGPGQAPACE